MIDRSSAVDAERVVNNFLPNSKVRKLLINFLADTIIYANYLNCSNWNLNLDKSGKFLRFNIGQVYCITISKHKSLIICLKEILKKSIGNKEFDIDFVGYRYSSENIRKYEKIITKKLDETPICLQKVPDSVGCYIKHDNILEYLNFLKKSNREFIDYAIKNTIISTKMKDAHSTGAIEYIEKTTLKKLPDPSYSIIPEEQFLRSQEKTIHKAKKLEDDELKKEISKASVIAKKTNVVTTQYNRNPMVSEFIKRKAKGICQDCMQPAPFVNKQTNEPYLECHHIVPLSDGGKDNIENVIALCPNCHRKRHYG